MFSHYPWSHLASLSFFPPFPYFLVYPFYTIPLRVTKTHFWNKVADETMHLRSWLIPQDYSNQHWHEDGHIDQWNRTESPEENSYIYGCWFLTRTLRQFNGERFIFSNSAWITGYPYAKERNCTPTSYHIQKLNPNWSKIKELKL